MQLSLAAPEAIMTANRAFQGASCDLDRLWLLSH
jgi:hypothetical protein